MSLFWRQIAAFGWGTFYSFLLHFVLILTEKKNLLQKKWLYLLIYLPAAINVFVFGLCSDMSAGQYNLINTYAGWVNVSENSMWDLFFNIYYVGFSIISIGLIWHWGVTSLEQVKKKQAYIMVFSYATTFFISTLMEIVINVYSSFKVPQIAIIIILITIYAMSYCIKRYGLMAPEEKSQAAGIGQILSEANRSKLFLYISQVYILGAFINFATQFFIYKAPLMTLLLFCSVIFIVGVILQLVQRLRMRRAIKDTIAGLMLTASIPFIILEYIEYSSITVWAIPIILVMVSVAFVKRQILVMVGTVTIITLIWVWIKVPTATVTVDSTDHIFRLGIFGLFLWIALYINQIYIQRLKDTEEKVKVQKMLSQISADLVTTNENNIDEKINEVLQKCGEYFEVDRTHIILFSNDPKGINRTFEWCDEGIESILNIISRVTIDDLPEWMNVAALSEQSPENGWLQENQVKSLMTVPLRNKEKIIGFLSFDSIRKYNNQHPGQKEIMEIIGSRVADVFLKVEAEKEIKYMAYYDLLTGLSNNTLLKNRLEQAINLANRTGKLIGVIFIDIDSFKMVNDTMGHDGGDALLIQMAQRLSGYIRKYDTVARFGGDEFLIILPQISRIEDIRKVADKIIEAIRQPLTIKDQEFFITASMGISVFPIDGENTEDLIKNADTAMYSSKEKGKNRYTFCSQDMKIEVLTNMELANSLYRAQERNELILFYQPQVSSSSGKIIGVEALIRWKHPQKGTISPGKFISLAEKNGLINPIGQWVLQTACCQNKAWQDQGLPPIRMAVNLSLGQFRNPKLIGIIESILKETGLNPEFLELEITESVAINEPEYIIDTLNALKALGVKISIDDFGTKYSSLSRLKILPIDRIKIDMQFVRGICISRKDEGIIKVIIQLGKILGLKVTAEGVETEQQLAFLKENSCDEIQGHYFYKPMSRDKVESILKKMYSLRSNI